MQCDVKWFRGPRVQGGENIFTWFSFGIRFVCLTKFYHIVNFIMSLTLAVVAVRADKHFKIANVISFVIHIHRTGCFRDHIFSSTH